MRCLSDCSCDRDWYRFVVLFAMLAGSWLTVGPLVAMDAVAAEADTTAATSTDSVPMRDLRHVRAEIAETKAARVSGVSGKILVICYGDDDALCEAVRAGASLARDRGEPVGGVIRAQGVRGVSVYGDGFPLETHSAPGAHIQSQTFLAITRVRAQLEAAAASGDVATR